MTFVGKVLVVVQLVLSIVFMAFAGAVFTYHQNWKQKYETANAGLEQANQKVAQLETQSQEREATARATFQANPGVKFDANLDIVAEGMRAFGEEVRAHAATTASLETTQEERDLARNQHAAAEAAKLVALKQTELANQAEQARQQDADTLRSLNLTAQADLQAKEATLREVEQERFEKTRQIEEMDRKYEEQLLDASRLRQLLLLANLDPDAKPESNDTPPPPVEGLVVEARRAGSTELVEITVGSDDGLEVGDHLYVYRDAEGKYLAKIRLVLVTSDRAVGSVVQRAKNGTIARGDSVASQLN